MGSYQNSVGDTFSVFHSDTQHIEIPDIGKSLNVANYKDAAVSAIGGRLSMKARMDDIRCSEYTRMNKIRATLHTAGTNLYTSGSDLVKAYENLYVRSTSGDRMLLKTTPFTKPTPPLIPVSHATYFLQGRPIDDIKSTENVYVEYSLKSKTWEGFRLWHINQTISRDPRFVFIKFGPSGMLFRELQVAIMCPMDAGSNCNLGAKKWVEKAQPHVRVPGDMFFNFESNQVDAVVGDVTLDKAAIVAALARNARCILMGQFLVTLFGSSCQSMRVLGSNLTFTSHPLALKKVANLGFVFPVANIPTQRMDNANVAEALIAHLANNFEAIEDLEEKPLVVLDHRHRALVDPVLALFWSSASARQRTQIRRIHVSLVNSAPLRAIFLAQRAILTAQKLDAKPVIGFHGIRIDSEKVAAEIVSSGFKSDAKGTYMYGAGGTYVALESAYSLQGFLESWLGSSNLGNYIFVALALPGRSLDGTHASNKPMVRDQESWYSFPDKSKIICARDTHVCPVFLLRVD
jgi:hypothetical protein